MQHATAWRFKRLKNSPVRPEGLENQWLRLERMCRYTDEMEDAEG
jgi:hypothetical protein